MQCSIYNLVKFMTLDNKIFITDMDCDDAR